MHKLRLIAALAISACAVMLVGGAGTAAAQGTPVTSLKKIPMSGQTANGKKFTGTYTVKRFVAKGDQVFAVGTLKGTFKGRSVKRTGLRIPVSGTDFGSPAQSAQAGTCKVLDLTLGPLDLNLLGLRVQLNQVHLQITAIRSGFRGGGLLGDLLCGIANLLNPAQANPVGQTLAQILNAILALLPQNATAAALPR